MFVFLIVCLLGCAGPAAGAVPADSLRADALRAAAGAGDARHCRPPGRRRRPRPLCPPRRHRSRRRAPQPALRRQVSQSVLSLCLVTSSQVSGRPAGRQAGIFWLASLIMSTAHSLVVMLYSVTMLRIQQRCDRRHDGMLHADDGRQEGQQDGHETRSASKALSRAPVVLVLVGFWDFGICMAYCMWIWGGRGCWLFACCFAFFAARSRRRRGTLLI